ncbi:hypothetical protein [Cupriavidus malaysiensis]|uniref:Uncharacterized protein n=1 Tax=Cupriavidus malaysiensis TaxID=367825 RepID=A0ABM6F3E7_9BURK|nr:hypothetical protein [Cupriavidus malaysiensis]AOZ05887.1 hypothetical protein BKK80_08685 [Cupriavidus malaysiensis]
MFLFDPFAPVGSDFLVFCQMVVCFFEIVLFSMVILATTVIGVGIFALILDALAGGNADTKDTPQKRADGGPAASIASSTDAAQTGLQSIALDAAVHQLTDAVTHSQGTLF